MNTRVANHPILPLILDRWSSRAYDTTASVTRGELAILFEAARWAPSSFNIQPWRFVFALRGDAGWEGMLDLLIPFNKGWAEAAGALICICSEVDTPTKTPGQRQPSYSHSFDTGAAWAMFALQASSMGLGTHAMTGFNIDGARDVLQLPDNVRPEAVIAVGRPGSAAELPEGLRERDVPSDRHRIDAFVYEHTYGASAFLGGD
ncbi:MULTISPECIES: nitroreductase family protein [Pseudomonas]|uniref:Nitroreductase family protein n=1 Tax=Pseudomonas tritici TaxID=2745518 RepID=A0A8H9YW57_9PSED|nr:MULTISPECIES: nitroreductase family protein [Pseudomonas]MBP2870017.1 nitroreductase family protein [Pseudomonas sp. SWRI144]QXH81341.1 nitroreductase family protein [Pseudomonas tritici]